MPKIFALLWLLSSIPLAAGFPAGTVVKTETRTANIEDLRVGKVIQSYDFTNEQANISTILGTRSYVAPEAICFILETNARVISSDDQQWYVANEQVWKHSRELKIGDQLLSINNEKISVTEIRRICEPVLLF